MENYEALRAAKRVARELRDHRNSQPGDGPTKTFRWGVFLRHVEHQPHGPVEFSWRAYWFRTKRAAEAWCYTQQKSGIAAVARMERFES